MSIRKSSLGDFFFKSFLPGGTNEGIVKLVNRDRTLDLQFRGTYINVYYRGGSLLKLTDEGAIKIHRTYCRGEEIKNVNAWLKSVARFKHNLDQCRFTNDQQELEYQQLAYRANSYAREAQHTDYFPIDREFNDADLLAIKWPKKRTDAIPRPFLSP